MLDDERDWMLEMEPLPSYIYRGEPPSPTLWANGRLPHRRLKEGGAHGQVGRPSRSAGLPVGPPTFSFFIWAASGVDLLIVVVWALVLLNFFSGGLLIHVW